ncbi:MULTISPECIES: sulfotransferase [Roseobacteraceae]|jgi:LPS sulfotransferase NodH|uniref:sulfotransferase n=1 Tax=Roseobacteraceae TaxID=2854170 RepID=UPI0021A6D0A5|nr:MULTISPECIES: sulfotransferase [Roseobacteraceae]UWR35846.1 sulfotransferase [Sulfitobacter sp. W027]UWR35864.1 sulfotransferase [Sulfitobacter sp. W027]
MKRFVILGLPRSGTTYLMSLLDAHRNVICAGEQYNPYAVIGSKHDDSHAAILGRDKDPVGHMYRFFDEAAAKGAASGGFKFMIGHNLNVLRALATDPEVSIIYVWRENRLAQVSSLIKAYQSKKWAQSKADEHVTRKIKATPRQISHRWHEYSTFDHLISIWLAGVPNPKVTYEYRELFQPGFEEKICNFLEVPYRPGMKSPLIKQSSNSIADRFEDPKPIRYYFNQIGLKRWLEDEL